MKVSHAGEGECGESDKRVAEVGRAAGGEGGLALKL